MGVRESTLNLTAQPMFGLNYRRHLLKRDWRYWGRLGGFVLGLALASGLIVIGFLSYQGAMTYVHPARIQAPAGETPRSFGVEYRDIQLLTQDGVELAAWYTASQNGAVILVAHGYARMRSAEMHALFAHHSYGVISWDARAHGTSGGETSTMGYRESLDVEAALDFALQQAGVQRVGAFGESMGGATVIRAAAQRQEIEAIVADSAYPALEEMVDQVVPYRVLRPLLRFFAERETGIPAQAMRPVDEIGSISPRPVFIIQGAADATVSPNSAQRLYEAAGEPRTLWMEAGVGHIGMRAANPEAYDRRVLEFFDASLITKPSD